MPPASSSRAAALRHMLAQRVDRDQHRPADQEICDHLKPLMAPGCRNGECRTRQRHRPDEAQHAPAPGAANPVEKKGRIGASDHDEDRGMIEAAQILLAPRWWREVVGGRQAQHEQQADAVETNAQQQQGIVPPDRRGQQRDDAQRPRRDSETMHPAIGPDLFGTIARIRRSIRALPRSRFIHAGNLLHEPAM